MSNVFVIGKGAKPWISLPKGNGIKLTIVEELEKSKITEIVKNVVFKVFGPKPLFPLDSARKIVVEKCSWGYVVFLLKK